MGPLAIFISSFVNKKAYWKISRLDIVCGTFSLIGLLFWWVIKVGDIAIVFSILADSLASIPTLVKSYRYPETENYIEPLLGAISITVALLMITRWDFANYGFPVYILLLELTRIIFVFFKIGKKSSSKSPL